MLRVTFQYSRRWLYIAIFACLLIATPNSLRASSFDTAASLVSQAKILYDDLEYAQSLSLLRRALSLEGISRSEAIEIYKYMGFIYLIRGEERFASASFELLLQIDRDYRLNPLLTPPRFIEFFEGVKANLRASSEVALEHASPSGFMAGQPMEIVVYMVDRGDRVERLNLYFRQQGKSESFSSARLLGDPAEPTKYSGLIPYFFGDQTGRFVVEYYVAALAADGEWLSTVGDPRSPYEITVEVAQPRDRSMERTSQRWWLWAGAIGLAGLAGGGVFLAVDSDPNLPEYGEAVVVIR